MSSDRKYSESGTPEPPASERTSAGPTVTGFYNGSCPVCRPEIEHYKALARRRPAELDWRNLSADPEALAAHNVSPEAARRRFHAIDEHGALVSGVDAFIAVWRNLPVYRHLAGVVAMPAVRPFADLAYERALVPALARMNKRIARRRERDPRPDTPGEAPPKSGEPA